MNSTSTRFLKPLQEFINSKNDFSIIYSTSQFISSATERVCVLDSSFNPPHKGHYALIEESLKYKSKSYDKKSILLLLSIKNADKHFQPESFDKRLQMMYYMAQDLSSKYPIVNVSIGITTHAKFVDKSLSVLNYITENFNLNHEFKITFLLGFDTLIRIFDPKYYLPDKLSSTLENFMKTTDLFCLTRFDEFINNDKQSEYIDDIKTGKNKEIPSHWSDNIHLIQNDTFATISSSSIRKEISSGSESWKDNVIPEIEKYIIENNLYKL